MSLLMGNAAVIEYVSHFSMDISILLHISYTDKIWEQDRIVTSVMQYLGIISCHILAHFAISFL